MPRIVTLRSKNGLDQDVISLVLSQDAVTTGPEGDPWCGVSLSSAQARCLAQRLSSIATEIENQETPGYRASTLSLAHLSSVVVVHDGSEQGHRAFQTAFEFASHSLCKLEFLGVFGISCGTTEAETGGKDCEWQKGWFCRLVELYSEQAASEGVALSFRLFSASDPCVLLDVLYRIDFDLIVIPKSLTGFGIHGERLLTSVVTRRNTNVFVCP